jgi:eukaryotic-like serine/threonine-protein kinase
MTATTETGRILAGRYRLEQLLGTGALGAVWRAHDVRLDRPVAVKEMREALASDQRFVVRFRREAQVAGSLSHPNLLRVFDCSLDRGRPFLVMEHVDGGTLAERLAGGRGPGDCRALARALLEGVAHIHAAGLVHRDLHARNVLIGADDRPRITGFGAALPEEAAAREPGGGSAADLHALGCLLAECTGGDGPAALESLIERLTADDPLDRPVSAAAALRELEAGTATPTSAAAIRRATADEPRFTREPATEVLPRRRTTGSTPPVGTPHPRRPRRIALAAVAVTAAVTAVAVVTAGGGDPEPEPAPAVLRPAAPRDDAPRRGGSEVDHSRDRLEGIVRGAQEGR